MVTICNTLVQTRRAEKTSCRSKPFCTQRPANAKRLAGIRSGGCVQPGFLVHSLWARQTPQIRNLVFGANHGGLYWTVLSATFTEKLRESQKYVIINNLKLNRRTRKSKSHNVSKPGWCLVSSEAMTHLLSTYLLPKGIMWLIEALRIQSQQDLKEKEKSGCQCQLHGFASKSIQKRRKIWDERPDRTTVKMPLT